MRTTLDRDRAPLLALFSDFGTTGPYVGQVMAVWAAEAPTVPRIELFSQSPAFDVEAGAHLLHAFTRRLPRGSVVEAVVDPGRITSYNVCYTKLLRAPL